MRWGKIKPLNHKWIIIYKPFISQIKKKTADKEYGEHLIKMVIESLLFVVRSISSQLFSDIGFAMQMHFQCHINGT